MVSLTRLFTIADGQRGIGYSRERPALNRDEVRSVSSSPGWNRSYQRGMNDLLSGQTEANELSVHFLLTRWPLTGQGSAFVRVWPSLRDDETAAESQT